MESKLPETALLERFQAATGYGFVEAHYAGFPLNAKILRDGKTVAVAQVEIKSCKFTEYSHYMQTIWKLEEGKAATADQRVPYMIIAKFTDRDALYEFDPSHQFERRDGKDKPQREQRAIVGSVFIPMNLWKTFDQWKGPKVKQEPKLPSGVIEEEF